MTLHRFILLTATTMLFAGCPARSINPLFTDQESLFNASLIGSWANEDEIYTFEKLKEKNYKLIIHSNTSNDSSLYVVQSGKIGSWWFLDSYPLTSSGEHHYLPVHLITKMTLAGDTLRLASLEADWLAKMISEKKLQIMHVKRNDEVILTASTKELQQLVATIGGNSEAFPNPGMFVRVR
jgi:hypothetical protein